MPAPAQIARTRTAAALHLAELAAQIVGRGLRDGGRALQLPNRFRRVFALFAENLVERRVEIVDPGIDHILGSLIHLRPQTALAVSLGMQRTCGAVSDPPDIFRLPAAGQPFGRRQIGVDQLVDLVHRRFGDIGLVGIGDGEVDERHLAEGTHQIEIAPAAEEASFHAALQFRLIELFTGLLRLLHLVEHGIGRIDDLVVLRPIRIQQRIGRRILEILVHRHMFRTVGRGRSLTRILRTVVMHREGGNTRRDIVVARLGVERHYLRKVGAAFDVVDSPLALRALVEQVAARGRCDRRDGDDPEFQISYDRFHWLCCFRKTRLHRK